MILCIADKKGRVQYNRLKLLQKLLPDLDIHIRVVSDKIDFKQFNMVYYSHFSLYNKKPCLKNQKKIASVTSHKCLNNKKKTLDILRKFDAVSVNNLFLHQIFIKHIDVQYLPNGVDTSFFSYKDKDLSNPYLFGWVGNKDRSVKNFKTIVKPLEKFCNINIIASSKSDVAKNLKSQTDMLDFYHSLDFFLVTSSNEGTPNPGLEALSCGVPVLTTKVGNMTELVIDSDNGFYVEDNLEAFKRRMKKVRSINGDKYKEMRISARQSVSNWDWAKKSEDWRRFLKQ